MSYVMDYVEILNVSNVMFSCYATYHWNKIGLCHKGNLICLIMYYYILDFLLIATLFNVFVQI